MEQSGLYHDPACVWLQVNSIVSLSLEGLMLRHLQDKQSQWLFLTKQAMLKQDLFLNLKAC